jgi:nickel/cobalt exporter
MEFGLLLIFWYGVLHAFGPDHLTAIADFSIGKSKRKTLLITTAFAFGHGVMLFLFAKLLEHFSISDEIMAYGDTISSSVIIAMGLYLLYLALSGRVRVTKHMHEGQEHIHISTSKVHSHDGKESSGAFAMGALMGMGGVRGMLITLSAIGSHHVGLELVLAFVAGVSVVFIAFGYLLNFVNEHLLESQERIRGVFGALGIVSIAVGANMVLS